MLRKHTMRVIFVILALQRTKDIFVMRLEILNCRCCWRERLTVFSLSLWTEQIDSSTFFKTKRNLQYYGSSLDVERHIRFRLVHSELDFDELHPVPDVIHARRESQDTRCKVTNIECKQRPQSVLCQRTEVDRDHSSRLYALHLMCTYWTVNMIGMRTDPWGTSHATAIPHDTGDTGVVGDCWDPRCSTS